jgi:predicted phage tail protein
MRQFITKSEGIQGYEVLIGDEGVTQLEELIINDPGMNQSYTFVPVIGGSKNAALLMVLGVALIAMTGGFAAFGFAGMAGGGLTGATSLTAAQIAAGGAATSGLTAGATIAGGVTAAQAVAVTQGLAIAAGGTAGMAMAGASYLGMGLLLGGASLLLAPDVPSGDNAEQAENYLFSGPINTVKQGQPIPLVYGRMVTGSKTIMGSLFTEQSRSKISKARKLVGIGGFREDGSTFGNSAPAGRDTNWWGPPANEMGRIP